MKGLKIILVGSVIGIACSLGSSLYAQDTAAQPAAATPKVEPGSSVTQLPPSGAPEMPPPVVAQKPMEVGVPATSEAVPTVNPELSAPPVIGNDMTPPISSAPPVNVGVNDVPPPVSAGDQKLPINAPIPEASPIVSPVVVATTSPAVPSVAPAVEGTPVEAVPAAPVVSGAIEANKTYTVQQLLALGYAVEMKNFGVGDPSTGSALGKAAAWKTVNGVEEYWQGIIQSDGQFLVKEKMAAPKEPKLLRKDWTGGNS